MVAPGPRLNPQPPLPQAADRLHSQPVVAAEQGHDLACPDLGGQLLIVYVHDEVFSGYSVPGFAHPAAEAVIALLDVSLTVVVRLWRTIFRMFSRAFGAE